MTNQLITVRLQSGATIIRKPIQIFDNGKRATIHYNKAVMIVRSVSWYKSGHIWIDPGLYAEYERDGDPELNALLRQQEREIAAQGEQVDAQEPASGEATPAAQEWTDEEVRSHDDWIAAHPGEAEILTATREFRAEVLSRQLPRAFDYEIVVDAASSEATPAALGYDKNYAYASAAQAISLQADVFNLDHSARLPRDLFRGQSAQRCLIENIHIDARGQLVGTVALGRGDLAVMVTRNMWIAQSFVESKK